MGLFGKSKKEKMLEKQNRFLRDLAAASANIPASQKRKVMYQCRYCGYKSVRYVTEGIPMTGINCPRHPRGSLKGPHSWMRTFL